MEEKKVLDSIVTVTEWIIKQTVDLTQKKLSQFFFKFNIVNISI